MVRLWRLYGIYIFLGVFDIETNVSLSPWLRCIIVKWLLLSLQLQWFLCIDWILDSIFVIIFLTQCRYGMCWCVKNLRWDNRGVREWVCPVLSWRMRIFFFTSFDSWTHTHTQWNRTCLCVTIEMEFAFHFILPVNTHMCMCICVQLQRTDDHKTTNTLHRRSNR